MMSSYFLPVSSLAHRVSFIAFAMILTGLVLIPLRPVSGSRNGAMAFTPPTVSLTSPTSNSTFLAGSTVTLAANAADSDGTVNKVEFFQGAVKLGEDTTAPYSLDWANVPSGSYSLTARTTDNSNEITTSSAVNITVLAQARQYVGWATITNGTDLGRGSLRKTSTGAWDFNAVSLQTLLPGDGYVESTAANYNQSIALNGANGVQRAVVIGSGGWAGIYENNVEVAATYGHIPTETITPHASGDRYRIEITNSILRYIRYRSGVREVMFTSAGALPGYPISASLGMSPQNAEWQKTVLAQLTRKVTWSSITNGIDLGNGSVRKTSTGTWDFSSTAVQTLQRGDGYFESTASYWNHSINLSGSDGAGRSLVVGTGGWAAIYENGAEVANTYPLGNIGAHAAGDRYRLEIANNALRYVRYRAGIRTVMYTSTTALPAYPLSFSLGMSFQNSEWQNTVFAQLSQTVAWSSITNGIDLGNGSVRKTSTGTWDFSAVPLQQLVSGPGYFESTASYWNHSINLSGSDGVGHSLVVGTGGWAAIYENGAEVANTYPLGNIGAHGAGDRYRMEMARGQHRYVRYRNGVRTLMYTSASGIPAYPLGFSLGMSFQNSEWQNNIFSDNVPEHNDAAFVSQTVPATMVPGQTYSVSVVMRNTGASTWTPDGDYQLGSENLADNMRWGLNRVNLSTTVPPGSDGTFSFTVTAPAAGSHSFQWRMVQQGVQRFGALSTNVNVQTVNNAPTVSLTSPANNATFTAPATVALAANAADSDGTITKVEFFQGSTKLGEDTTSPYTYSWTSVPAGTYVLTAKVTDNGGATAASSAVNITVNPPNQPPTVSLTAPTNGQVFSAPANITLSATAADSDGIVSKVQFFQGTTLLGEDLSAPFTFNWNNVATGAYSLTAKATDNAGAVVTSTAVAVTVNALPTVSLTAPTNGQVFSAPANIALNATAADTDGTISKVQFFQGATLLGEDLSSPFTFNWNNVAAGSYSLTAKAIDNQGAVVTSTAIPIIVNTLPTVSITSPTHPTTFVAPATFTITATASDPDGSISKVEFFAGAGLLGEDTTAPYTFTYSNLSHGSYVLTAKATDNRGGVRTSTIVSAIVTNAPTSSISSPANNAVFAAGSNIIISAFASDTDGSIAKVEFFQGAVKLGEDTTAPYSFNWNGVPAGAYSLTTKATDDLGITGTSAPVSVNAVVASGVARLDPMNHTGGGGEDALSRNYNWGVPLISLPGRAGLDLRLSLNYNSLVWTKSGNCITFDDDAGFPSPGFRLGFPVIQGQFFNSEAGKNAFLLITGDGSRVELRQVGASTLYESVDSSHLLLDSTTMILRTTDGSQLSYVWYGSDFQCTQIKDRNGNFITVNYTSFGRIDTIVDTLARTIKFNYNAADNTLASITQSWAGQAEPHVWASFSYSDSEVHTNFVNVTNLGPANGATVKTLRSVTLNDNSRYDFDYTYWAQVWKINNFAADGHLLKYRAYNLPGNWLTALDDCPRFTERHDWAENWNRTGNNGPAGLPTGAEQEALTASWAVPVSDSWNLPDGTQQTGMVTQLTSSDGAYSKIYFAGTVGTATGWQRGLPSLVETYASSKPGDPITKQKSAVNKWTQEDTNLPYLLNPRVEETNVYDYNASGQVQNRARTQVTYQNVNLGNGLSCRLPSDVYEYQANATTVMRRVHTDYNLDATYTGRRIIGLASEKLLYETDPNTLAETLMSRVGFAYDEQGSIQGNDSPVQHDAAYGPGFVAGRANLSSVKRYDVVNAGQFTLTSTKFNTAGAPVLGIDALNRQTSISYADSYSDGNDSRNTLAYVTSRTDADGFTSTAKYNFDFGAITRTQTPAPAGQTVGTIKNLMYDTMARLQKLAVEFNGNPDYSYTRFEYPTSQNRLDTYATLQEGMGEAHSFKLIDGHGRVFATAADHPGSAGGFSGQLVLFDKSGQMIKSSNPTETSASGAPAEWAATGDDAQAGWLYTQQTYDWKGRPLVTSNTDLTTREASYSGCGCAGGDLVTLTDEGTIADGVAKRRQVRIYNDVLGRPVKTEVFNWESGSIYSTTVKSYNARNQVTLVRAYAGPEGSGTYQDSTLTYDGYGRLKTKHLPEYSAGLVTMYDYNPDDTVQTVTDPRGTSASMTYNNRQLITGISYAVPTGSSIPVTAPVTLAYDGVGNRTAMSDGMGGVTYQYDRLSRMTSETRTFSDPANSSINGASRTISYAYNLAGEISSITDPFGAVINYGFDVTGRLNNIAGSGYAVSEFVQSMQYRAWNTLKSQVDGNGITESATYNSRLQLSSFEVRKANNEVTLSSSHQYYNDGQLKFTDALDERFDRAFAYDQAGRIKEAYSGSEARDFINGTSSGAPTGPYRQTFQYNAFNQVTQQIDRLWSQAETTTNAFMNNRREGWTYDEAGRLLIDDTTTYTRDAAGRVTRKVGSGNTVISYDGNGQVIETIVTRPGPIRPLTIKTYFLRATPMSGLVVADLNTSGQKTKGYVYAGKRQVAETTSTSVTWTHEEPVTGSKGESYTNGFYAATAELNANGVNIGLEEPVPQEPGSELPEPMMRGMNLFGGSGCSFSNPNCTTCYLDGMEHDCGHVMQLAEAGAVQIRVENSRGDVRYVDVEVILGVLRIPGHYENTSSEHPGAWEPVDENNLDGPWVWNPDGTTVVTNINYVQGAFLPVATQAAGELTRDQRVALDLAKIDVIYFLRGVYGKFSDKCKKNVLDKLATIGFTAEAFTKYLEQGNAFYDGDTSTTTVSNAFPGQIQSRNNDPLPNTVADLFAGEPRITAMTSVSMSQKQLTVFFRGSGPIDTSPDSNYNRALMFHEGLHGFGSTLTGGKVGAYGSVFGAYGDQGLLTLFGLNVKGPSSQITKYIQDNCF